jgi:uncharacterized protein
MDSYRIDVRPILDEIGTSVSVADALQIEQLTIGDEVFVLREPVSFQVTVSNTGEELVAVGSARALVTATCVRCLCDFVLTISGEVEGQWPRPGHAPGDEAELSGRVDAEGRIDIGPEVVSALVAEAPFAPLHDEACAGLCATCGADLNEGPCECHPSAPEDHPFAALKDLLGDPDDA